MANRHWKEKAEESLLIKTTIAFFKSIESGHLEAQTILILSSTFMFYN